MRGHFESVLRMDDGTEDVVAEGEGVTYRVSAYVTTFDDTIAFALVSNGNLWNAEERAILNLCRPGTLSEGARLILSRLSLRRPKWIKSNSISHYVPYHQKPGQNVEADFHAALDSLERHSFLEYVNTKSPFETAYEAVESSFLSDDLTILYKKLTTQKNVTNGNNKPLNKEGLLEAIMQAVRTQKTLFGQPLMHKFSHTVVEVLKELPVTQNRFRNSFPQSRSGGNGHGNGNTSAMFGGARGTKGQLRLLRINPQILHLLRRCQRLYQISCNASNNGHSGNTSSNSNTAANYYATGAAAANNTSAATTGFASVLQPLEFNAPLLVLFRKVCYPEPYLHCSSSSGGGNGSDGAQEVGGLVTQRERERCSRIFASMVAFRRWEGAVELHAACLDRGIEGMLLDTRSTDRLSGIVATFASLHFAALSTGQSGAAQLRSQSDRTTQSDSLLRWTQWLVHCRKVAASPAAPPAAICAEAGGIADSTAAAGASNSAVKKPVAKKRNSTEVELSALSTAHLLAVLCILSYASAEGSALRAEDYLIKFDAGTQLAYAISDAACQCEKEPFRQYPFAVLLYELLLLLPYLPHRRGSWYKRLCINYAHLQLPRCALRACYRCSADPLVNVSDKTDLAQRSTALRARLQKLSTVSTVATNRPVNTPAGNGKKAARGKQANANELPLAGDSAEQDLLGCYAIALDFPTICPGLNPKSDGKEMKMEVVSAVEVDLDFEVMPTSRVRRKKVKQEPTSVLNAAKVPSLATKASKEGKPHDEVLRVLYVVNALPPHSAEVKTLLGAYLLKVVLKEVDRDVAANRNWLTEESPRDGAASSSSVNVQAGSREMTELQQFSGSSGGVWNLSSVTKRAQTMTSSSTVTASPRTHTVQPVAPTAAVQESWSCQVCTYVNDAAQTIACAICMHAKPVHKPAITPSNPARAVTVSATSTSKTTATASVTVSVRSSTASVGGAAQGAASHIVDLLSDDEDDEVSAVVAVRHSVAVKTTVPAPTPPKAAAPLGGQPDAAAVADNSAVEALCQEVEAHSDSLLAAAVARCQSQHTSGACATDSAGIEGALNLALTTADEDEEGTDLVLLGLLASTHLRDDGDGCDEVGTVRPSLENIIPAPPFFVVSGKRIGDPSRKGKSLFCGLNGELVNVEEYVLQKCYAVDPDEVAAEEEGGLPLPPGASSDPQGVGAGSVETAAAPPGDSSGNAVGGKGGGADNTVAVDPVVLEAAGALLLDLQMQQGVDASSDLCAGEDSGSGSGYGMGGFLLDNEGDSEAAVEAYDGAVCVTATEKAAVRRSPRPKRKLAASVVDAIEEGDYADADCQFADSPSHAASLTAAVAAAATTATRAQPKPKANTKMDASRRLPYTRVIDGGGWQGWHCEGAVFQSLFGLLMWDTLFTCPCAPTSSRGTAPMPSLTECVSCNVFVTPFQDGPLDLGYRSFFQSRRDRILARIAEISSFSTQEMIAQLGDVYRAHYGETCRGVHWGMTLPLLQVMAVCMGGPTVAAVCRAMTVNFKHFTGGAPDLMLVRVQRRVVVTPRALCPNCSAGAESNASTMAGAAGAASAADTVVLRDYEVVHLSELLGVDWATQMRSEVKVRGRDTVNSSAGGQRSAVSAATEGTVGTVTADTTATVTGEVAGMMEVDGGDEGFTDFPVAAGAGREAHASTSAAYAARDDIADSAQSAQFDRNWHICDLFLPQLAPKPPIHAGATTQAVTCPCRGCGVAVAVSECGPCQYEYKLQAKFVEVKGPTDSLMYRQRVWLQILNSSVPTADAAGGGPCAVVCHVKE